MDYIINRDINGCHVGVSELKSKIKINVEEMNATSSGTSGSFKLITGNAAGGKAGDVTVTLGIGDTGAGGDVKVDAGTSTAASEGTGGMISPTQKRCGNASVYCPLGSSRPTLAPPGYYTILGLPIEGEHRLNQGGDGNGVPLVDVRFLLWRRVYSVPCIR